MKQPLLPAFKILFAATFLLTLSACNNTSEIPFPAGETEFPQPVSRAVKFSEPWKIAWSDSITHVKPLVKNFDFNKLPVRIFDSSGFLPFAKKPEEVQFNWDKLPDTAFNYDSLPSQPLKFETSVLEPPQLIKSGHPYLKTGASSLLYEFGELQGLMGTYIICMFEDKTGFLWIATDLGVYRYDGENLLLYFRYPPAQWVNRMIEDSQGNIWMGTSGNPVGNGLFVIDVKAGIVKHLSTSQGLRRNAISNMLSDNQGRIWITSFLDGINIIDENTHTIKYFDSAQGLSNKLIRGIIKDDKNNIWISTRGDGINIVDLKNGKIKYLNKEHGLNNDSLALMLMDNKNRIWISTRLGDMNVVDVQQETIRHFNKDQGLSKNFTGPLLNDRNGNIWISTGGNGIDIFGNGAVIIDPASESIKSINTLSGLIGNDVNDILQDKLGQIWIATHTGLNMFNKNGNNIEYAGKKEILTLAEDAHGQIWIGTYKGLDILDTATGLARSFTTANGLCNDTIQNMILDNGNIWIGTNGGIDIIDSAHKTIQHLGKAEGLKTEAEPIMMKDKQGMMWLGASSNDASGVDLFDLQKNTIHHLGITEGLRDTIISDIKQDRKGQVWITTFTGGVYVFDPEKNTMKYMNDLPGLKDKFSKLFLPDKQGNMWIGTDKGIYIVNAKGDSLTAFSTHEGLINDNIISLNQYNGRIYVGTRGGITIITPPSSQKNWHVESFGKAQGINKLNNSYGSDIITTKGLFLWGDMGITVLNTLIADTTIPKTHITGIDIFNQPQYFANNPWTHTNENDTLWNSRKDTFYLKGKLPANTLFPQQDKMQWDSVTGGYNMPANLHLPYYQNYLQFHFAQANLGSQDTTWYSYILQGKDKKWSERTFNAYSQNYLNLPSGGYIFKVSGMYKGRWSEPVAFKFTISPPWWQTWWAYAVFIFIFSGLVWVFAQYRSRKLQRENMLLEEKITRRTMQLQRSIEELKSTQAQLIQSEKMASLGELTAGIAHEIQNPLNFVNNFSEVNTELIDEAGQEIDKGNISELKTILNDIKENEQKINHHGKRAGAIVKGMLQHSRTSSGKKEPTDINALADEYLRLSYHGLRAKDKTFNATMRTDFDERIGNINIVSQDIGRVLLNLINNAFYAVSEKNKTADENYQPTVTITTKRSSSLSLGEGRGEVEIKVKDNGNGIPQKVVDKIFQPFFTTKPTGQGTGLGLSLSYDIIKAHGGEIKVETKEGEGAELIIRLPLT